MDNLNNNEKKALGLNNAIYTYRGCDKGIAYEIDTKLIVNSREIVTDYLGLEIDIEYCNDKNKFVFENLNISSI